MTQPPDLELAAARADNAALRRRERQRTDALLTLAHELRNPLTAMGGALDILKDTLTDRINPKEREFFEIVDVSLARLNQMLDEMLEITTLEGHEVELHYEPTSITQLAREVAAEYEPRAQIYGVKIAPIRGAELTRVECDPELIRRVVANLTSNAIKYNKPGGTVTITVTRSGEYVKVTVEDEGIGIPEEDRDKVFQRFYRSAEVRQKGIVGTGLGLAIARSIVEMHKGRIDFESRPAGGTVFHFALPVEKPGALTLMPGADG